MGSEEGWPKQPRKGDLRRIEENMNRTHEGGNECGTAPSRKGTRGRRYTKIHKVTLITIRIQSLN